MSREPSGSDPVQARPSLRTVLRRGHFRVAFVAVALAGLSMTLLAIIALRVYADHNLQLIARSISYNVEAAVVFNDTLAMDEALTLIAPTEEVADAQVLSTDGKVRAQWSRPSEGLRSQLEAQVANLLLTEPVSAPIRHQDRVIGTVVVSGNGGSFLRFLTSGLAGIIGCLALSVISAQLMSRRVRRDILKPLRELAVVAHSARVYRTFDQRVPVAAIAELNDLSNDFNSLLGELEKWQAHFELENQTLAYKASHDTLTGLPNRAFFEGRLSRAIRNADAQHEQVVVLFLDSDRFKSINDTHGHAAGDTVLISVAARVTAQLREHDLVARLGGDEFAVLLAPVRHISDALNIVDDIIASMSSAISIPGDGSVMTSLSIGVAVFPLHGRTPEQLLEAADTAMYQAKKTGRGGMRMALPNNEKLDFDKG